MEIYFCEGCRTRLSDADIAVGEAVRDGDSIFCRSCAIKLGIYQRAREEARREEEKIEEAPVPRTSSRRRAAAGPVNQNMIYLAFGVGIAVLTALVVVLAKKGRRKKSADRLVRPIVSVPVAPAPRPERTVPLPPAPQGLPERVEFPPVVRKPAPPSLPVPKPPPPRYVSKPPPLPPPPAPRPVEEGWKSIFNGSDMKGWRTAGGRAYVEDGALVSTSSADFYYKADWAECMLACEMKAGGGQKENTAAVGLAQSGMGRGRSRVRVTFHSDGDAHVNGAKKRLWRSGSGKFPLADWTPLKFEIRKDELKVFKGEKLMGTVNLSQVPMQKGGVYFYAYGDHTARMRNVRVRVLSR